MQPHSKSPGSSIPLDDYLEADIALAKVLQQEEYKELQLQRDLLLAYEIANGTVDDADIELAYYTAQKTESLIVSMDTSVTNPSIHSSCPMRHGIKSSFQFDSSEICDTKNELHDAAANQEASFIAALKLQEQFDQEMRNEAAWDNWSKDNIKECDICGEHQHYEELFQPCEHSYCITCIVGGFKSALASKQLFKCCRKLMHYRMR